MATTRNNGGENQTEEYDDSNSPCYTFLVYSLTISKLSRNTSQRLSCLCGIDPDDDFAIQVRDVIYRI